MQTFLKSKLLKNIDLAIDICLQWWRKSLYKTLGYFYQFISRKKWATKNTYSYISKKETYEWHSKMIHHGVPCPKKTQVKTYPENADNLTLFCGQNVLLALSTCQIFSVKAFINNRTETTMSIISRFFWIGRKKSK